MKPFGEKKEDKFDKIEPKVEVREEEKATEQPAVQTFVVKTELDAYVNERLINQPKSFDEIKVKDLKDDSLTSHLLTLPKDIKKALDDRDMVPFWINKKKRAIDHAIDQRGWTIFTRTLFPKISKHNFTANGTVEIGDCILGFMPAKNAELLRRRPGQISQERVKNLPIEAYKNSKGDEKIGYYKPALSAEPDGQIEREGAGLYSQPDVANINE